MSNRLATSASPYLLQHQHNPVDWYPWGPEALERARSDDRPILLSVGYSACHWCHVMERESFEDEATAAHMNAHFVNIKVDREERPDLDGIYMQAVQQFTGGHGGWPMTVFLLPDGRPYYGGTYFPPAPRHGMPSFTQVMDHALRLLRDRRREVESVSEDVLRTVRSGDRLPPPAAELAPRWLDAIAAQAAGDFDARHAGFGRAPKFPPHGTLTALLAHHHRTGAARSLDMVSRTLEAMARGGMYDVLGGGFARYSVDAGWVVPHFEKMLYDNALLLPLYVEGYLVTGRATWARIVRDTVGWLERDMLGAHGAFYAAMDADSEGEEGRYFVFTPAQVVALLGDEDGARACDLLGITAAGTFEHGSSVVRMASALEDLEPADAALLRERAFPALLAARTARIPPATDDKIVTAWNALMLGALARAGAALGEPAWIARAEATARFLLTTGTRDGRLLRSWRGGVDGAPGFADDHAFLIAALIDLYEATLHRPWLERALELADRTIALFWDADDGGLYYTGHDAETLVSRSKSMTGGALPSANGVAALSFVRLAILCGRDDLRERAERIVRSYQLLVEKAARALGPEALAAEWLAGGGQEIGIVGAAEEASSLVAAVHRRSLPFSVLARTDGAAPDPLLPWMADRDRVEGAASAWVCRDHSCLPPVTSVAALDPLLDALGPPARGAEQKGRVRAPALPTDPAAWIGGEPRALVGLRGRVVVLDFWTQCCINCLHVLPELEAVERRFAGRPVVTLGVHTGKFSHEREAGSVRAAAARLDLRHPVINDPDRALWEAYAVRAWPTVIVIDAQGREAWRRSGEIEADELGAVVQRLLDEGADGVEAPRAEPTPTPRPPLTLRAPGKVSVWPGSQDQARGADALDGSGRLYVSDTGRHRVLELALRAGADGWPLARLSAVIGQTDRGGLDDGAADTATLRAPQGTCREGDTLWIADTGNHAVRAVDLRDGRARTVAGTGQRGRGLAYVPGPPTQSELRSPWDVEVADDAVFVAMAGSHQIWVYLGGRGQIGPMIGSGAEHHVDGAPSEAALAQPSGMALFGRHLFWVDAETSSVRLADLEGSQVSTLVGRGLFDFGDVDGAGEEVRLQHPMDLAVADGLVWVADTYNHKIKRIDPSQGGRTTTVAGGDGSLDEPSGLDVLGPFLVVADTNHDRICVVERATGAQRVLAIEAPPDDQGSAAPTTT